MHRNVANQVLLTDINFLASLEYAVKVLRVKHIIVSGHYGCGGVKAEVEGTDNGLIENWVQPIRQLYTANRARLGWQTKEGLLDRVTEMSVVEQVKNLLSTAAVMENLRTTTSMAPTVHGVVIDFRSGIIKELPLPIERWQRQGLVPRSFNNNNNYRVTRVQ